MNVEDPAVIQGAIKQADDALAQRVEQLHTITDTTAAKLQTIVDGVVASIIGQIQTSVNQLITEAGNIEALIARLDGASITATVMIRLGPK